jgi:hypothetical protein
MKNKFYYFVLIGFIIHIITPIDIKELNENSQLKIQLKQDFYFTTSLYINDKELILPLDISSDRTWINKNDNILNKNNNKKILKECYLYDVDIKRKKNVPMSFFDKDLLLEEIAYDEINYEFNDTSCYTKYGIIGLGKKSEKKIYNLLTQLNKVYSLKRNFLIYNNELIIGNFDKELKENKYISTELVDTENKWAFNLQGIYYGEISKNNFKDDYFIINKMNDYYKKLNIVLEFNSLQKYIIVDFFYFNFIKESIFNNKCSIKRDDLEDFEGIYCDKKTVDNLYDISFMINDKLLTIPKNSMFVKISSNEYLFIIVFAEIVWGRDMMIGSMFYNELGNKVILDGENNRVYFLSENIIEKVKIVDEYSIDEKQILNNNSFTKYDFVLCGILILNFLGILMLLGALYKEKVVKQLPNNIKKIRRMNKK